MIKRSRDRNLIAKAIGSYEITGLDLDDWVSREDEKTIAITDGNSVALFQEDRPSVYFGHWFFKVRGKAAKTLAFEMLAHAFDTYPIEVIIGFTPIENLGARWLARHIGFKSQGVVNWKEKDLEFFMLTKSEWKSR